MLGVGNRARGVTGNKPLAWPLGTAASPRSALTVEARCGRFIQVIGLATGWLRSPLQPSESGNG